MFVSRIVSDKRGEGDQGIGLFCTAAASIPSVQCAESPARLSGCVTDRDTLYWALVDGGDLQPIAIGTIDAQEAPNPPEGVFGENREGGWLGRSVALTECRLQPHKL